MQLDSIGWGVHVTCGLNYPWQPLAEDVITGLEFPVDLPMWPLVGQEDETKKRMWYELYSFSHDNQKKRKCFLVSAFFACAENDASRKSQSSCLFKMEFVCLSSRPLLIPKIITSCLWKPWTYRGLGRRNILTDDFNFHKRYVHLPRTCHCQNGGRGRHYILVSLGTAVSSWDVLTVFLPKVKKKKTKRKDICSALFKRGSRKERSWNGNWG